MSLPTHLLVATDFSEAADHALAYAVELARAFSAKITLLHAYNVPMLALPEGAMVASADWMQRASTDAQERLDAIVAQHQRDGVLMTAMLRQDDPRDAILTVSGNTGADLIVVGTHGRRGLSRALLGSVAENVLRHASIPVLTVRARG